MGIDLLQVALDEVQAFDEVADIVLEKQDCNGEEDHFHAVPEAHRLEPDSEGKFMRAHICVEVTLVVKSEPFFFEVVLIRGAVKCQHVIGNRVLEDGAAGVYFTVPLVHYDSVCNVCLHYTVELVPGENDQW